MEILKYAINYTAFFLVLSYELYFIPVISLIFGIIILRNSKIGDKKLNLKRILGILLLTFGIVCFLFTLSIMNWMTGLGWVSFH